LRVIGKSSSEECFLNETQILHSSPPRLVQDDKPFLSPLPGSDPDPDLCCLDPEDRLQQWLVFGKTFRQGLKAPMLAQPLRHG
jgi:hypothetical protein